MQSHAHTYTLATTAHDSQMFIQRIFKVTLETKEFIGGKEAFTLGGWWAI